MLIFHVSNRQQRLRLEHFDGAFEFGRGPQRETARCVLQDPRVSRDHLRVEELPGGRVRLDNLSETNLVHLADESVIDLHGERELALPARLTVGDTLILIEPPVEQDDLMSIAHPEAPGASARAGKSILDLGPSPSVQTLAHWFESVIAVQRAAGGSPEFYQQTAQALIDLVGLDRGLVLLARNGDWEVVARVGDDDHVSKSVLARVVQEQRTFYQSAPATQSLSDAEAVVASPVLAPDGTRVIGVLYGARNRGSTMQGGPIGPLEAQVVQMLAAAVGVGMARQEQEAAAARHRVRFEQFFSPQLALELERNPQLLDGQEREVTILAADIRGFSRLSERLAPRDTCDLVADVMQCLTTHVREQEGVVVDYAGDGLLAMWNAPAEQPEHAKLACRAAVGMLGELPGLSERWQDRAGGPLAIGIGINTGPALVGNTGSQHKFKYGPLGHTVNLASRVEGATKHFRVPALITGSTRARLGDAFATRRLCRVRVVGMREPVEMFELHAGPVTSEWLTARDAYEGALEAFEAGRWAEACRGLYPLLAGKEGRYDTSSLDLITRALACLKDEPENFDPVRELQSK